MKPCKSLLLLLIAVATALSGCGKKRTPTASEDRPDAVPSDTPPPAETVESDAELLRETVRLNLAAMEREDLDGVLLTVNRESPIFDPTRRLVENAFALFELDYELEGMEILESGRNRATIRVVQITRADPADPDSTSFRDNRIVGVHELRKIDGRWLFHASEVKHIEFLEREEPPTETSPPPPTPTESPSSEE